MSEENTQEQTEEKSKETQEKSAAEESVSDSSADAAQLISQANEAAERLEKANAELKGLIQRQEELKIRQTLGGKTHAGTQKKSKEELEIAEAKKLLEGTGFEDIDLTHK